MDRNQHLFAYGTLRRSYFPDKVAGIRDKLIFVGEGETNGLLYDIGTYPAAVRGDGTQKIKGDVFLLREPEQVLRIIDQYEGIDDASGTIGEFVRLKECIRLNSGGELLAWIYWYNQDVQGRISLSTGDYLEYLKLKKTT